MADNDPHRNSRIQVILEQGEQFDLDCSLEIPGEQLKCPRRLDHVPVADDALSTELGSNKACIEEGENSAQPCPERPDSEGSCAKMVPTDSANPFPWSRQPGSFRSEGLSVSFAFLSSLVRPPSISSEDSGKGYEGWLREDALKGWQIPITVSRVLAEKVVICAISCVPAGLLCWLFSLMLAEAVDDWHHKGIEPLQDSALLAGIIGEPFHELQPSLLYSTFATLALLCPILCCQTKMVGTLVMMHGRKLLPVWRISVAAGAAIVVLHTVCVVVMHVTGGHVPRMGWMAIAFAGLFAGLLLCARSAARILRIPEFTFLFSRAALLSNVVLYIYAVLYPFWFFRTDSLGVKGLLAIVVTPAIEFANYFLHQHTAIFYRGNDPKKAIYPAVHYGALFSLYGNFLLVNFQEPWQNIVSLLLVRGVGVVMQVYAQEVTYVTYRVVLRKKAEDVVELLRTLRFKAFKHNMINLQTMQDCFTTVIAGMIRFWCRFDNTTPGSGEAPGAPGARATGGMVLVQIGITLACAFVTDACLALRKTKWHSAWEQRDERFSLKVGWLYFVSTGMFAFYFYPFLARRYVLPHDS